MAGTRRPRASAREDNEETAAFLAVPGNLERVEAGEKAIRSGDLVPASVVLAELAARRDGGARPSD